MLLTLLLSARKTAIFGSARITIEALEHPTYQWTISATRCQMADTRCMLRIALDATTPVMSE